MISTTSELIEVLKNIEEGGKRLIYVNGQRINSVELITSHVDTGIPTSRVNIITE